MNQKNKIISHKFLIKLNYNLTKLYVVVLALNSNISQSNLILRSSISDYVSLLATWEKY